MKCGQKIGRGFTLVEIMIVIVVVAILATITIVGYSNVQDRTHDAAVKSDLSSAAKLLNVFKVNNAFAPHSSQLAGMHDRLAFTKDSYDTSSNAMLYCQSADRYEFGLVAKSKSGTSFFVTSQDPEPQEYTARDFPGGYASICPTLVTGRESSHWVHSNNTGWSDSVD